MARQQLEDVRQGEQARETDLNNRLEDLIKEKERVSNTRNKAYVDKLNGVIEEGR